MTRFALPAGAVLPALLVLAIGEQSAEAEFITYEFELTLSPASTTAEFFGETVPTGPLTGTLTFDQDATPSDTPPGGAIWHPDALGSASQATLNVGGSTFSTELGELDAFVADLGGSASILFFAADMDANTFPLDGKVFKDDVEVGAASLAFIFETATDGPLGTDLAGIDLLNTNWDGTAFGVSDFTWVSSTGDGQIVGTLEITSILSSGSGAVVPEPHSAALWCLAAMVGVGFILWPGTSRPQRQT